MPLLQCPPPAALTSLPAASCPIQFDQIVRIVFQRSQAVASFTAITVLLEATWTPLLVAVADTKIVISPLFAELVIPQSEALTSGGNDNSTFNGIPDYNGEGSVNVVAQISNLEFPIKKVLKTLTTESMSSGIGLTNLTAFFINREGSLIHNAFKGFPVYNFRIGSVGSEGFNAKNKHQIGFSLPANWDDDAAMVTDLGFDILSL